MRLWDGKEKALDWFLKIIIARVTSMSGTTFKDVICMLISQYE